MAFRMIFAFKNKSTRFGLPLALALALGTSVHPAHAQHPAATLATLLDKADVEATIIDYYALFGERGDSDFGSFYTDDGILDANGVVRQGREAINALYKQIGAAEGGKIDILINNMKVVVNGETATADLLWTECSSKTLTTLPLIVEQGREHDDLVKVGGHWRLKKRVVTNDGGLPKSLLKGYIER
jgi:ketosteroid isomerase-like protein